MRKVQVAIQSLRKTFVTQFSSSNYPSLWITFLAVLFEFKGSRTTLLSSLSPIDVPVITLFSKAHLKRATWIQIKSLASVNG